MWEHADSIADADVVGLFHPNWRGGFTPNDIDTSPDTTKLANNPPLRHKDEKGQADDSAGHDFLHGDPGVYLDRVLL